MTQSVRAQQKQDRRLARRGRQRDLLVPEGWMSAAERMFLFSVAQTVRRGGWVEVGVYLGRSLSVILPVCKHNRVMVHAVDPWVNEDTFKAFLSNMRDLGYLEMGESIDGDYYAERMTSAKAATTFVKGTVGAVFIDGDHAYEAVRADLEAWDPLVMPGGWIMGHDWNRRNPGVVRAVREHFDLGPRGVPQYRAGAVWAFRKEGSDA
jgi:predicted O-methyltransferase YrrM